MTLEKEYDAIVVGAGPNGLICAAYLARAGIKVLLLERRHECGGGLDTLELAGFKYNPHAVYHLMADVMPPFTDLGLGQRGVKYIFPDVQACFLSLNQPPILLYRDPQKTGDYLSHFFSSQDGECYKRMLGDFREFFDKILLPLTYVPPVPAIDQVQALQSARDDAGKRFNELSELSPTEILEEYGFTDPLKAALLNLFSMWGLSNYDGLGFLFPLYVYRMTNAAIVSGGSHRLSSALYKSIIEWGGHISDMSEVDKVLTKDGQVCGVRLANGTEISSPVVASTVDPEQNFVRFFNSKEIPDELVAQARKWEWEKTSLFGVHLALKEAPIYSGGGLNDDLNRSLITFLGVEDTEQLLDHLADIEDGNVSRDPLGHVTCASLFDPIQSFERFHTGRFECLAPFDANWEDFAEEYAAMCIEKWRKFAPNLEVISSFPYPPTHIQKKIINMVKGSIKHGSYKTLQMGYNRPMDSCSQGYTPIEGFYVCGASTYPGGMVIGGPGYLGANIICEDMGVEKTWQEPDYIKRARKVGFISQAEE